MVEWVSFSVFVWMYVISRVPKTILPFGPSFSANGSVHVEVLSLSTGLTKRDIGVFLIQPLFMVKGMHEYNVIISLTIRQCLLPILLWEDFKSPCVARADCSCLVKATR